MLHKPRELLQWLCHDDSTINIVLVITIIIIIIILKHHSFIASVSVQITPNALSNKTA